MNYKLHYAPIELDGDIPFYEFKKCASMIDFIDEITISRISTVVWLLAKEGSDEIFISEHGLRIQEFIEKMYWETAGIYFLQEYASYEEAYKVALDIMEINPLCYE